MSDVAQLRSDVERLERELVEAKEVDTDPEAYRDLKLRLREARRQYRVVRAGGTLEDGDAAVTPRPVEAAAGVDEEG